MTIQHNTVQYPKNVQKSLKNSVIVIATYYFVPPTVLSCNTHKNQYRCNILQFSSLGTPTGRWRQGRDTEAQSVHTIEGRVAPGPFWGGENKLHIKDGCK